MRFSKPAVFLLPLCLTTLGQAQQTITVGSSGQYTSVCDAFNHASDGNTIQIDANGGAPYYETRDCVVKASNVSIIGVNGRPVLDASQATINKGIWVLDGHDITIDNFEFRNARVGPDNNSAGIRIESGNLNNGGPNGGNITIRHSYIHDNNDGLLGGNQDAQDQWYSSNPFILLEYDEFARNGNQDAQGNTHNIYIGFGGNMTFTMQYSWTHDSYVGHTLKSRAPINNILYNLMSDQVGNTSYLINFPLGGKNYVVGNSLYKIATTNSSANKAIFLMADVYDNGSNDPEYGPANQDLHFINNTVVNDSANGSPASFLNLSCSNVSNTSCAAPNNGPALTIPAVVENNIFVGPQTQVINQPSALVRNNVVLPNTPQNLASLFVNAQSLDFHLAPSSPAIRAGINPPTDNTGAPDSNAVATHEYVQVANGTSRPVPNGSTVDAGAYSYWGTSVPVGRIIAIRSNINGLYLTTDTTNGGQIVANASTIGTAQLFKVVSEGGNNFALQSLANNLYVSTNLSYHDLLAAAWATSVGSWEVFTWNDLGSGNFALLSPASNYYVSTNITYNNDAQAAWATTVGTWEQYSWVDKGLAQ